MQYIIREWVDNFGNTFVDVYKARENEKVIIFNTDKPLSREEAKNVLKIKSKGNGEKHEN